MVRAVASHLIPSCCYYYNRDAPAVSEVEKPSLAVLGDTTTSGTTSATKTATTTASDQWDDAALAAATTKTLSVTAGGATAELLDMKALESTESDNIAERMRVEETKAALQAARDGMEREAARLKEEQEKKKESGKPAPTAAGSTSSRFGAAGASFGDSNGGGMGSKWVPPHLRSGGVGVSGLGSSRERMPGSQKLDTQDESLFPDLASADKILEKEKLQGPAYKVPKKTPVGGGATWGSRAAMKKPEVPATAPPKEETKEPFTKEEPTVEPPKTEAPAPEPKPSAGAGLKKKKKKDLSTFKKPGSS